MFGEPLNSNFKLKKYSWVSCLVGGPRGCRAFGSCCMKLWNLSFSCHSNFFIQKSVLKCFFPSFSLYLKQNQLVATVPNCHQEKSVVKMLFAHLNNVHQNKTVTQCYSQNTMTFCITPSIGILILMIPFVIIPFLIVVLSYLIFHAYPGHLSFITSIVQGISWTFFVEGLICFNVYENQMLFILSVVFGVCIGFFFFLIISLCFVTSQPGKLTNEEAQEIVLGQMLKEKKSRFICSSL